MARANRHYIPGNVWHITHRCHKKEFLLKFGRDRRRWIEWLFEARKYDGLVRPREKEKKGKKTILVPGEEKARAFHEEEKRLQKFPRVTNLNKILWGHPLKRPLSREKTFPTQEKGFSCKFSDGVTNISTLT